jgi:cytidine deaminase
VIDAPFSVDATVARRMSALAEEIGPAVEAEVAEIVGQPAEDPLGGCVVAARVVGDLVERYGLGSARELALLALPVAGAMARPPISGYRVAAIGLEAGSGDLVLGANLEFPGADLGATVHAEGFVALRVRRRGRSLEALAVREAHPCAHCRQTLAESADADRLAIIDPLGHDLPLEALYPWPFRPAVLGERGDAAGFVAWPALALDGPALPSDVAAALLEAGSRAHAPYSSAPSAVVLRLRDGRLVGAGCVESVAFNPSITALQAALVEVAAARAEAGDVVAGWLGRVAGGAVDPEPGFRALLRAVAPDARADVRGWRAAG